VKRAVTWRGASGVGKLNVENMPKLFIQDFTAPPYSVKFVVIGGQALCALRRSTGDLRRRQLLPGSARGRPSFACPGVPQRRRRRVDVPVGARRRRRRQVGRVRGLPKERTHLAPGPAVVLLCYFGCFCRHRPRASMRLLVSGFVRMRCGEITQCGLNVLRTCQKGARRERSTRG
jgi:hypothetical protein